MDALDARKVEFKEEYMGSDTLDPLTLMLIEEEYLRITNNGFIDITKQAEKPNATNTDTKENERSRASIQTHRRHASYA